MVPVKGFLKWGMERDLKTPAVRPTLEFRAPFCPARFINHPRCTKAQERRPTAEHIEANPNAYRRPHASFKDKNIRRTKKEEVVEYFDHFGYVTRHNVVKNKAICNIKAEEPVFAEYGKDYSGGFG